jgi:hypothetical protein
MLKLITRKLNKKTALEKTGRLQYILIKLGRLKYIEEARKNILFGVEEKGQKVMYYLSGIKGNGQMVLHSELK